MIIDINQKRISIGDKYRIYTDGVQTHYANRKLFRFLPEVNLFETGNDHPVMTIRKRLSFFEARYDIVRYDNAIFEFTTRSYWKAHYQIQAEEDLYEIFGHKGRKYSVYKNDKQIAWWTKEAVTFFAGDNYRVIADSDADINLVISCCLVIDNFRSDSNHRNTINIDFGRIGPQARQFDDSWMPKV